MESMYIRLFRAPKLLLRLKKGLMTNLRNIFDTDLFDGYYEVWKTVWDDEKVSLSIIRIPQELNVSPKLWAQLVEPGWRVKMQFEAVSSDVGDSDADDGDTKDAPKKIIGGLNLDSDQGKGDDGIDIVQDIIYVANMYQQDGTIQPNYLGQKTFKGRS